MTSKKLTVFAFIFVLGFVVFQFTRNHSENNAENSLSREPSNDTSASNAAAKIGAASGGKVVAKSESEVPLTQPVTAEDLKKLSVLKQILETKNDNDPRLDSDFKSLTENAKKLMREEYKTLKPESFNEKGTVIFLLGRNLKSKEDFDFLASVLSEPPCQNMSDCSAAPTESAKGEAAHEESINQVTLSYPQILTLKALDSFLTANQSAKDRSSTTTAWAKQTLDVGAKSPDPTVSQMAHEISHKISSLPN